MKADRCGTWTEQVMFRQGYITSKQRQEAGIYDKKCGNCAAMVSAVNICSLGRFANKPHDSCDKWEEKHK